MFRYFIEALHLAEKIIENFKKTGTHAIAGRAIRVECNFSVNFNTFLRRSLTMRVDSLLSSSFSERSLSPDRARRPVRLMTPDLIPALWTIAIVTGFVLIFCPILCWLLFSSTKRA